MARLCVRVKPNLHPTDSSKNDLRSQEGDVICIVEDSHVFSHAELTNGHYKIIEMPGVKASEVDYLSEPSMSTVNIGGQVVDIMLKKRKRGLDLTTVKNNTTLTKTQIDTAVSIKV